MTAVFAHTDEVPELDDVLARRHARGQDTYDEWWDGVLRLVTGPSPEHGELLGALSVLLDPIVERAGLKFALPVNIGTDKADCRVPDLGVYRPDTERTSPAFLATAELVVEVLSPSEKPGEKLPFYLEHNVGEYLEIDLQAGTVRLLANVSGGWRPVADSRVLGFVALDYSIVDPQRGTRVDVRSYAPRT